MKTRFEDNYCIAEYYDYCESQIEAGSLPSNFDTWLDHEIDNQEVA